VNINYKDNSILDESNAMCGWDQASKLLGNEKGEQDDTIN
jgi:hypothetical protein